MTPERMLSEVEKMQVGFLSACFHAACQGDRKMLELMEMYYDDANRVIDELGGKGVKLDPMLYVLVERTNDD
jgi:hypothetical protein